MVKLLEVKESTNKNKKLMAVYDDGKKIHFGTSSNYVYNKNKTDKDRVNYIKRHSANPLEMEALTKPRTPATLSMMLLWGRSRSLNANIRDYKKKYNM